MNLMPLVARLEAAALGTPGTDLFLNMMPATAERAILLRSPLRGTPIDYELPGYYRTEFQLIVRGRGSEYVQIETRIKEVIEALTLSHEAVGACWFNFCRPLTEPVSFPLSDGNLFEFSVNFDVSFVKLP